MAVIRIKKLVEENFKEVLPSQETDKIIVQILLISHKVVYET